MARQTARRLSVPTFAMGAYVGTFQPGTAPAASAGTWRLPAMGDVDNQPTCSCVLQPEDPEGGRARPPRTPLRARKDLLSVRCGEEEDAFTCECNLPDGLETAERHNIPAFGWVKRRLLTSPAVCNRVARCPDMNSKLRRPAQGDTHERVGDIGDAVPGRPAPDIDDHAVVTCVAASTDVGDRAWNLTCLLLGQRSPDGFRSTDLPGPGSQTGPKWRLAQRPPTGRSRLAWIPEAWPLLQRLNDTPTPTLPSSDDGHEPSNGHAAWAAAA